ncbi:MAG TPA: aminopeptidase [Thermoplasmata archaeon]|nr:aminopeptidase [Thermoplasmata archaeon]
MAESYAKDGPEARYARWVLTKNLHVKRGERVTIEGWSHSLPWAVALAREARRLGARPLLLYEDEGAYWDSVDAREDALLGSVPDHEWAALGKTDVFVHLWGAGDRPRLVQLGPARAGKLTAWNDEWYRRAAKAGVRGARLEVGRVYPTLAERYGVDEATWTDQLVRGTMVDPRALERAAAPLKTALERGRTVRIFDDDGTDLTLGLARRPATVLAGQLHPADYKVIFRRLMSLPAGSMRVALDEKVAEGTIVANRTCFYEAATATGGRFTFKNGKLVDHSFESGGEIFDGDFRTGGKGRDQPGLLGIGLNPELRNTPQLEDAERGAILVSVGGNRMAGGKNPSSLFGFVINAGAKIEVDGKPLPLGA